MAFDNVPRRCGDIRSCVFYPLFNRLSTHAFSSLALRKSIARSSKERIGHGWRQWNLIRKFIIIIDNINRIIHQGGKQDADEASQSEQKWCCSKPNPCPPQRKVILSDRAPKYEGGRDGQCKERCR